MSKNCLVVRELTPPLELGAESQWYGEALQAVLKAAGSIPGIWSLLCSRQPLQWPAASPVVVIGIQSSGSHPLLTH